MSPNIQKSSAKAFRTYDFENELFRISDVLNSLPITKLFVHEDRLYSSIFR